MSRSRKKAILKDVGNLKRNYWKIIRRKNEIVLKSFYSKKHINNYWWISEEWIYNFDYNNLIKKGIDKETAEHYADLSSTFDYYEEPIFVNPKELVNDYDYRDYTTRPEFKSDLESKIKYRRK